MDKDSFDPGGSLSILVLPVVGIADHHLIGVDAQAAVDGELLGRDAMLQLWQLADERDQLGVLGLQLLESSCQAWISWFNEGAAIRISVPAHSRATDDATLARMLDCMARFQVPPAKLELRFDEADLIENFAVFPELRARLRRYNIALGLEAFGASYERLGELRELGVDSLRVRPDYIGALATDPTARLITATTARFGVETGARIIGTGVVDNAQWDFLREAHCDAMSGAMIAAPLATGELMGWAYMNRWQRNREVPSDDAADQPPEEAAVVAQDRRRALVVDDDALVRKVLERQLHNLGFDDCITAGDGEQALNILAHDSRFDILFCDLKMPGTDGIQFLREAAHQIPHVSVVLISSVDSKILKSAASLAQAHHLHLLGTLSKPISSQSLTELIDRLEVHDRNREAQAQQEIGIDQLRAAIAEERIVPRFQPQVDVSSGRVVGVEALVRWPHADGLIPPDRFLPLAQANGLMDAITALVLKHSLVALRGWTNQGLDLMLSVNLDMETLGRLDFPERLIELCRQCKVPENKVQLEVTESSAMDDPVRTLDVATRLRMKGFDLSIDDFGTGYSTFSQLRELPFNELKIDQSFVCMAHQDAEARSIVENNIKLAHGLNMRCVAEGVETAQDWRLLQSLGCDLLQGYFVSAARTADDFASWLTGEHALRLAARELPP